MSEILGDGPTAGPGDDGEPSLLREVLGEPLPLALTSFTLAVITVWGSQLFRGVSYTAAFAPSQAALGVGDENGSTTFLVVGAFLSAGFSLIPLLLGVRGLRRVVPDDPRWVTGLLQAALALAFVSLVLRLVLAVITAAKVDSMSGFFSYLTLQ